MFWKLSVNFLSTRKHAFFTKNMCVFIFWLTLTKWLEALCIKDSTNNQRANCVASVPCRNHYIPDEWKYFITLKRNLQIFLTTRNRWLNEVLRIYVDALYSSETNRRRSRSYAEVCRRREYSADAWRRSAELISGSITAPLRFPSAHPACLPGIIFSGQCFAIVKEPLIKWSALDLRGCVVPL